MDPGDFMSAFGGLPYVNPFMSINLSETCATTRLIQCTQMGINSVEVSRKFARGPGNSPDLHPDEFATRKRVLEQVFVWNESEPVSYKHWELILYNYEIVKGSAKRARDWGHMLFTNATVTEFLLVMVFAAESCNCGNPYHHDFAAATKYQADRMLSLLKYIHFDEPNPRSVRATYVTHNNPHLPADFLHVPADPPAATTGTPPVYHITPDNFTPALLPSDLDRIDSLRARLKSLKVPPADVRRAVTGTKEGRYSPDTWTQGNARNARQCAYCEKIDTKALSQCAR
ncbi:hypothetical protein PLICRDRAFT_56731 [Plicaturopsis crispa FD-325 SS-3]|nr:hypothetical protein PLICRDRAFT_56731 [Plicaturopsis crispa FD-325 SS-3]